MRKVLLFLAFFLLISSFADAQIRRKRVRRTYQSRMQRIGEISYMGSAGISSYFGDLKQNIDLWAKPSLGGGVQYRFSQNFSLRGELLWYRISGDDTYNDMEHPIYPRNLSFRSDNLEGSVVAVGYLYNKYARGRNKPSWNPYAFAGIGFTTNTPKAYYQDEWHSLRPLQTEDVAYSPVLLSLPFGIGVTYHDVFPQWDMSFEIGYRYTGSDYLDDVSTKYPDPAALDNPLARALSDRRDEFLQERNIPKEQAVDRTYPGPYEFYWGDRYRGNPGNKDWYMISAIKVVYSPGPAQRRRYRRAKF
ncbi:hypothetical protein D770_01925 [Flammeovirgaceae bacterium 311]|nr:hypothetical protein D770_01925 [Flammeovirgaceae bacterium 311]